MMTLEVMFPVIGETIEKKIEVSSRASINISELESLLAEAQNKLDEQESFSVSDSELSGARFLLNDVCDRFESEKNSEDGKMHLLADIRRAFLEMDKIEDRHSDEQLASEISSILDKIIIANGLLGENNGDDVERAKKIANSALAKRNTIHMKEAVDALRAIHLQITLIFQLINAVRSAFDNFISTRWKDQNRARQLVDKANSVIDDNPTAQALIPIIRELFSLMDVPESEKPKLGI